MHLGDLGVLSWVPDGCLGSCVCLSVEGVEWGNLTLTLFAPLEEGGPYCGKGSGDSWSNFIELEHVRLYWGAICLSICCDGSNQQS